MSIAQAPSAQNGVLPQEIAHAVDALNGVLYDISHHIVGNEYMIRATGISLVARTNIFFYGLPGISKTMLAKLLARRLRGKFHRTLYNAGIEPAAIFGVEDFKALQEGRYERVRAGSILDANIHFADELFRASDYVKDMMLGLFDEEPTYEENGNTEVLDDLLLVMAASNTLPGPEDAAIGDRLVFQLAIAKPQEREDRKEIAVRHLRVGTGELSEEPQAYISVSQVKELRAYARKHVQVPDGVVEKLVSLDDELTAKGIYVSPRTLNRCLDILRAAALLDGRTTVTHKDIMILQYVVAPIPQQGEVRDIIYDLVAPLEREALEVFSAISKQVGEWRAMANNPDKRKKIMAKKGGQDVLNDIADYREQLEEKARQAAKDGYDAEGIENMVGQVEKLHEAVSQIIRRLYKELSVDDAN